MKKFVSSALAGFACAGAAAGQAPAAQAPPAAAPIPAAPAAAAPIPAAPAAAASPAAAPARVMTVPPEFLEGPEQIFPPGAREAGHHGKVMITALIGTDGRVTEAAVFQSSGSAELDQASLETARAAVFSPARDASGAAMEVRVRIPYDYSRAQSEAPGGGLAQYRCAHFAVDMDWWRATFPDQPWSEHELYAMINGVRYLTGSGGLAAAVRDRDRLRRELADFDRRWIAAIDTCRQQPERRLVDVLQPEGAMIERLSDGLRAQGR